VTVNEYALYVKLGGAWEMICRVEATTHTDALRVAGACLRPEHADLPIRFQQEPRGTGAGRSGTTDGRDFKLRI
jgi:hypothetical protein